MEAVRTMNDFDIYGESFYEASSVIYHSLFVFKKITDLSNTINITTPTIDAYDTATTKSIVVLEVEQP